MKKKNIFIVILCICLCTFALINSLPNKVGADSGWGGGYDGGGSSSGGSSGGGSWGGSSGSSSGGSIDGPFEIILVIAIIIIIVTVASSKKGKNSQLSAKYFPEDDGTLANKAKDILPSFDVNSFRQQTYDIYKNIQTAWMNFDYDELRKYVTDELFNQYNSQLIVLKTKNQQNVMKDFTLSHFNIIGVTNNTEEIAITVIMNISCYDYIVDSATNKSLRGNDKVKVNYQYKMTFIKSIKLEANKCPNCNAVLENVASNKCSYCESIIVDESHDWVLSKKEVLSQTINTK